MGARVFTPTAESSAELQQSLRATPFLVVGFCAAWCNTCGEFRVGFERLADARPDATFVWLDIEDDAELTSDIDVENFPTIAVYHGQRLVHFGVSLPQSGVLSRLLDALTAESATVPGEPAVVELAQRLRAVAAATG